MPLRRFFYAPTANVKNDRKEHIHNFALIFFYLNLCIGRGASCGVAHYEIFMPDGVEPSNLTISTVYQLHTFKDMTIYIISNNVVCATSKASDQPAQTRSLI